MGGRNQSLLESQPSKTSTKGEGSKPKRLSLEWFAPGEGQRAGLTENE